MRKDRIIGALLLSLAATAATAGPGPKLASQVTGIAVVALSSLPDAPAASDDRESCTHLLLSSPATPAGQAVAAKGWGVTGEVPFGPYTAVSFVGGYVAATSGTCELLEGNVGLFSGDRLVALIYAADDKAALIGQIVPFGTGGARIFSGDVIASPLADLRPVGPDGAAVTPPALDEPVCANAGHVPYIYGLPIDMARILLIDAGWQPAATPGDQGDYSQAADIAKAGVPEVQDCSGTGFGFCGFNYDGPVGTLGVTTAGEMGEDGSLPAVVGYGVTCAAGQ